MLPPQTLKRLKIEPGNSCGNYQWLQRFQPCRPSE
jgi:hypothetical protein